MIDFNNDDKNLKYFESDMIYHYTKLDTAMEWILKNKELRFSSFSNVNDPFEKLTRSIGYVWEGITTSDEDHILDYTDNNIANRVRLDNSKLLCFSQNDAQIKLTGSRILDLNKYYRTGFFKPRMWAQYGDDNRGICIAISRDELKKEIEKTYPDFIMYHSPVSYSDAVEENRQAHKIRKRPSEIENFEDYYINVHIRENKQQLFFNKNYDWQDEKEYRFLLISNGKKNDYFVDIRNAIKGVFCGIEFPEVYMDSLHSLTRGLNIDIFKLLLKDGLPSVIEIDKKY